MATRHDAAGSAAPYRDSGELRREHGRSAILLETGGCTCGLEAGRSLVQCRLYVAVALSAYCGCSGAVGAMGSRVGTERGCANLFIDIIYNESSKSSETTK